MTSLSRSTLFRLTSNRLFNFATRTSALVACAVVLIILVFLFRESLPALQKISVLRFATDKSWHPLSDQFNLVPMLTATLLTSLGAILIAGPLGLASAIFSTFYAPKPIAIIYQRLVELLAGIPSVVLGLWGLVVLAPIVGRFGGSGQNLLTATLILAIMILPTVALGSYVSLRSVPRSLISAGTALGLSRWVVARRVAVPAARSGITTSLILAISRAIGETMAVLMVAGNVAQLPSSLVSPVRTTTANIVLELGYASTDHRSVLFFTGYILMVSVIVIVFISEFVGQRNGGA